MEKLNPYQQVTNTLINMLDDAGTWSPPWRKTGFKTPTNAYTLQRYNGSNILMCWASGINNGFASTRWATFKQWAMMDCKVKKGAKGTPILRYNVSDKEQDDGTKRNVVFASTAYVFNAEQVDGERALEPKPPSSEGANERNVEIESFIAATNATISYGGDTACYIPSVDKILMPDIDTFHSAGHFYSTSFHELVHWTGAKNRLDRELSTKYGSDNYAYEELVAELGAAFLSADWGISNNVRDDHAKYLNGWLKIMKQNSTAIVSAASLASKAVEYISDFSMKKSEAA